MKFLILTAIAFVVYAADDDAFEIKWTESHAKNCRLGENVYTHFCELIKVGDTIQVPGVEDCAAWMAVDREENEYEEFCRNNRRGCLAMKNEGDEVANEMITWCAEANRKVFRHYAKDLADGKYVIKAKTTAAPETTEAVVGTTGA